MSTQLGGGALGRVLNRAATRRVDLGEHCEMCRIGVAEQHRHLFDTEKQAMLCVCQACSLLFDQGAASEGHYRLVPRRRVRLDSVPTKALGVPVGLAFFIGRDDGSIDAHYPSPAGPTRWELDPPAWQLVLEQCAELRTLKPDVEALLINTVREERHQWIVPIDDCFRLVALVRVEWKGLSGGSRVWPEIERFFTELTPRR